MSQSLTGRAVAELPSGSQFVLWCLRVWAAAVATRTPATVRLRDGFVVAGLADALPDPLAFLELLGRAAERRISLGGCKCHRTTPDEGRLLAVFAHAQHREATAAVTLLRTWLPPVAAGHTARHAERLAGRLAAADMPVRQDVREAIAPAASDPGLRRLH